jgi:mono/diheme cytochrome c family protein
MHRLLVVSTLACLGLSACFPKAGTAPGPLSANALASAQRQWPGTSGEELERGRQLFLQHCDACHSYPDRAAYSEQKWPSIARRMGAKADLPEADTELVLRFILANRLEPGAPPPPAAESR